MEKKKISALNIILIVQLILMFGLSIGITQLISASTTGSSDKYMQTITEERSRIILNYVENVKNTLSEYSHAGEILNVVKNPEDKDALDAAQKYTEKFSKDIVNLEGIYVSEWNTHVLAHSDTEVLKKNMTTRKGEPLKQLQDAMLKEGNGVYDTGIISSPATGKQIVSMYKAVYDDSGEPVGLVGVGVYTEGLVDVLDTLSKRDMENSFYSMVNVRDKKYIFNSDVNKISSEASTPELILLCDIIKDSQKDETGKFRYTVDGVKYVSLYSYMSDKGWLFMVDDTETEIYSLTKSMRGYLIVFSVFCIILIVIFNIINKKQEETSKRLTTAVEKQVKTKESLNTAIFSDILTDLRNRISFSNDFEDGKISVSPDMAYYFAMFNIRGFSGINIMYGEEAGDMVLVNAAKILNKNFSDATVYRTGSDEFVVAARLPKGTIGYKKFGADIENALENLSHPFDIETTKINVAFAVSAVCKSNSINISVLPAMKNIMNMNINMIPGPVNITDLDIMSR